MFDTAKFFDGIFNNSKQNAILIMDTDGIIQQVNEVFTTSYGYTNEDLHSKYFRLLFTEKDRAILRPEIELNITQREGSHTDENYIVHKDGTPIWVTGEAILVRIDNSASIVKIIHNIHAQKQLERYLLASTELLDSLFNSVQSGLLLLDSGMRTIKMNNAFRKLFRVDKLIKEGSKIQDIPNSFWSDLEIKNDIRNAMVHGGRINKEYVSGNEKNSFKKIHISSKLLLGEDSPEKRLLLVIKEA